MHAMTSAIIVAAGSSQRMGFNKLLAPLGGVPVIVRTVRTFDQCDAIDEIIVVGSEAVREELAKHSFTKLVKMLPGGSEALLGVRGPARLVGVESNRGRP